MPDNSFTLIAEPSFGGAIGGTGEVIGTADARETVTLLDWAGSIRFDSSFNRGGDRIVFPHSAGEYEVSLSGSALLIEGSATSYLVPLGTAGTWLGFADGWRLLVIDGDSGEPRLGSQVLTGEPAQLTAESADPGESTSDPEASAIVLLSSGAHVALDGNYSVYGTTNSERIMMLGGTLKLDPSTNRGGDTLNLPGIAPDYAGYLDGSSAVLTSPQGSVTIPVGLTPTSVDFSGREYQLVYSEGNERVRIGNRAIVATEGSDAPPIAYTAVHVLGDSLVDSGNALALAEWADGLPLQDLPEGAPTAELGFFMGRFSDGYTFADLVSNTMIGLVSDPVFPFGYDDPVFGIPIAPFAGDPQDPNLNWAYGGAQIIQGGEVVPDLDGQTDALRDAVDGEADPQALYVVTLGGNDVRELVPHDDIPADAGTAQAALQKAADKMLLELTQLHDIGAVHFLITGIPDVGLIPRYDLNQNGMFDTDRDEDGISEADRSALATEYSQLLDEMVRTEVVPGLEALGATVTYIPLADIEDENGAVLSQGALSLALPTLASLYGIELADLQDDLIANNAIVFFDQVHPTAQVHALVGAQMLSALNGTPLVERMPFADNEITFSTSGSISVPGEEDKVEIELVAGQIYTFEMLGIASLGVAGSLADPEIRLFDPDGAQVIRFLAGTGNDAGLGLEASVQFVAEHTGTYAFMLGANGELTGDYVFRVGLSAEAPVPSAGMIA